LEIKEMSIEILRHPPKVSLLSYQTGTPKERQHFIDQLFYGLKEFGSVLLTDHGLQTETIDEAYKSVEEFFSLSEEIKKKYCHKEFSGQRGYTPFGKEKAKGNSKADLKEFWHVGRELPTDHHYIKTQTYFKNIWPNEISGFKNNLNGLYSLLDRISRDLLSAIEVALHAPEKFLTDMVFEGNSILRGIHYPKLSGQEIKGALRAAAHGDINLITLMVGPTDSGLEILDRKGKNWIPVSSFSPEIEIHAGDMLSRITNEIIPSSIHRVINPTSENKARYSMPFFVHPAPQTVLKCIPSCLGKGEKYPQITSHAFLMERLKEINLVY
jgi:isopenicillin N synthase-like dioxygenase